MRALSPQGVLHLWETGQQLLPVDRGAALLGAALPGRPAGELDGVSIGEQQRLLFQLRALTFGYAVDGVVRCPSCQERLEFEMDLRALLSDPTPLEEVDLRIGELDLRIRPLSVGDLRAAARAPDPVVARRMLGERAVVLAMAGDEELNPAALPDTAIDGISTRLGEIDSSAETVLELDCPGCGEKLSSVLDAGELLWSEIQGLARRLIGEVHLLAAAYGWTEDEILALSPARRQAYLTMVAG